MFKQGDKITIKKNIPSIEFTAFGNYPDYVVKIKKMKYVTIKEYVTDIKPCVRLDEIGQFWRAVWFDPYLENEQLEFDFEK
jgi:hypothetical protein